MVLGPLDKRIRKTRCEACCRRRIKCEGGSPCLYCRRKKLTCTPQSTQIQSNLVFINQAPSIDAEKIPVPLLRSVPQATISLFTNHFFTTFLVKNDFAGVKLDLETIITEFQSTPSFYHAAVAVGAIDFGHPFPSSVSPRGTARLEALKEYRASIVEFQKEINSTGSKESNACLWTTFFLGLFELMFDSTGDGWVKHIFYGTSRMLQIRGPKAHLTGPGRSFFLTARLFEICRSCFFPEPTFLDQVDWKSLMDQMWEGERAEEWHPKESLLDLMIACSSLGHRIAALLNPTPTQDEIPHKALLDLASEGINLRTSLSAWQESFQSWLHLNPTHEQDPRSVLAHIYYHGISIYLSGHFDYRYQFNSIPSPSLPSNDIQVHVSEILQRTEEALKTTCLAGILFLFPLRVAGARARTEAQRARVLGMLDRISESRFVVAQAFSEDLRGLWGSRGLLVDS